MKDKRKFVSLVHASTTAKKKGLKVHEVDFALYTTGNTPVKYFVGTDEEFETQRAIRASKRELTGRPAHRPKLDDKRQAAMEEFLSLHDQFTTSELKAWIMDKLGCRESTAQSYAGVFMKPYIESGRFATRREAGGLVYKKVV